MTTPTKNKQYIGKIVIKGVEEVSVFGPTLTDTIIELNRYIEQYKLQGPMDIAVYKDGLADPLAIVEQEEKTPTKEQIDELYAKLRKELRFQWEWMVSETPGSESNRKELFSKVITEWEKIRNSPK